MTSVVSSGLQPRADMRSHSLWAQEARADPHTRYLICQGTAHLVRGEPDSSIALLSAAQAHIDTIDDSRLLLLGWYEGERCVLVDLPADAAFACPGATFEELRPLLPVLSEAQAQLLSVARALVIWRARQRHCGVCAAPTEPRSAGHMLACTGCGAEFFPRIDPAIIVLVTDGTKALLGRQASWPAGRYSALAGFVEPGESLEQAVAREVEEESGVQITEARYFASQPWPFPASLMLGFHARASAGPVRLDGELEDARWFELGQLRSDSTVLLPPAHTIARRLIEAWFAQHGERAPGG